MKWYGTKDYKPDGRWKSVAARMVQDFQETGHPVFTSISALNRGILRKDKRKDSIHFNAESTNSELLFKIIFSVNQLSVHGPIAKRCYQFGSREGEEIGNPSTHAGYENKGLMKSVEADEINSLVSTPRLMTASRHRSGDLKTFDCLPKHSQLSMLCDLVPWRKVKPNDFCSTKSS